MFFCKSDFNVCGIIIHSIKKKNLSFYDSCLRIPCDTDHCQGFNLCLSYSALKTPQQHTASSNGILWHYTNGKIGQPLCKGRIGFMY